MPQLRNCLEVALPVPDVFGFFLRPANVLALSPPELRLELTEGPELMQFGTRLTWKGRRWGIAYRIVTEVVALEANALIVEEQQQGPLRKWRHVRRFEPIPQGTRLTEEIDFEPPGGLLGLTVTARTIEQELETAFAHRAAKLPQLLGLA
jgi:ligand-binding SRPBCC domain-containing protein